MLGSSMKIKQITLQDGQIFLTKAKCIGDEDAKIRSQAMNFDLDITQEGFEIIDDPMIDNSQ